MIVYLDTKAGFREDVRQNRIADRVAERVRSRLGFRPGKAEFMSWEASLSYMDRAIDSASIPDDAGVALEYRIPATAKRVDFILAGQNADGADSIVIVELKQWSEVEDCGLIDHVRTFLGGAKRETPHPSYQAWSYATLLRDFNEEVDESSIGIRPCTYLHNCGDGSTVLSPKFAQWVEAAPVFLKPDADKLREFLAAHVRGGDRNAVLYRIDKGRIRPSKQLAEHVAQLIQGNRNFVLIDDQKSVYERSLQRVRAAQEQGARKEVVLVQGGPGTGKSVVAVNLLAELVGRGEFNAAYITRNAAPRRVYEAQLAGTMTKSRISSLFRSSGGFHGSPGNAFDALVIDEAHRLTKKSGLYGNLGENQILELIDSTHASIFFVDDRQCVTIKDIGTAAEIERCAKLRGARITHMTLSSQFRCNGSDGYLAWLDHTLQIEETAHTTLANEDFDFRVMESPRELRSLIERRNREGGRNKSRIVAGYCWPWASKKDPGAMDICIPEHAFAMQWNLTDDGGLWIMKPGSIDQVGCIHTCQGLELDYVGVILGEDLIVRDGVVATDSGARASQDQTVRGLKKLAKSDAEGARALADRVIKNTYRTLMSRGLKGCYVWSVDEETNEWLRERAGLAPDLLEPGPGARTGSAGAHPFRVLASQEVANNDRAVRIFDLSVAAGVFSGEQHAGEPEWIELPDGFRAGTDHFVARIDGESMNRRVPNGAWGLFRAHPKGTREGKLVLVQHASITDPELGGSYTLKVYGSEVVRGPDGETRKRVILRPDSWDRSFQPIVLDQVSDDSFQVLAELVATIS